MQFGEKIETGAIQTLGLRPGTMIGHSITVFGLEITFEFLFYVVLMAEGFIAAVAVLLCGLSKCSNCQVSIILFAFKM